MTMMTVDDLARDLKVRNEDLLKELAILGYHVEGPESPLETDDPAALRAQLTTVLPHREIVEKRIKPTVIRRRVKNAPSEVGHEEKAQETPLSSDSEQGFAPSRTTSVAEPTSSEKGESPRRPLKKIKKPQPARIIEMAPRPPVVVGDPADKVSERMSPEASGAKTIDQPQQGVSSEPLGEAASVRRRAEPGIAAEPQDEAFMESAGEGEQDDQTSQGAEDDRLAKRKKKKEKRQQPAQIIGRVELKKEPARIVQPEREPEPARPTPPRVVERPRTVERVDVTPGFVIADVSEAEEAQKRKKKEKKTRVQVEERVEDDKLKVRRRKEVVLGTDLYDERSRPLRLKGRGKKVRQKKTEITTPKAIKRRIKLPEAVTVSTLAHKMSVKAS
ncbi:MAG: translation initiation factor [Thermodesulfobacteriota bacterium]|nr:translation initiation factor [Thermodesulfobacteriota bacterium]